MPTTPTVAPAPRLTAPEALRIAADLKQRWRDGVTDPDAAAALAERRELAAFKSVVIDLAYEEYCLREEAGAAPGLDQFCPRFGPFHASLRKVLDAHHLVADHPELLAAPPVEWPAPNDVFEGLELVGELGRGAFGRAYVAFDPQTSRPCVLKLTAGPSAEARVIGGLRHPNVIDVYWARPVGRLSAVCMPLVGTTTLDEAREVAFTAGPPATADALLAAIDPAGALAHGAATATVHPGEPYATAVTAIAGRMADALAYLHRTGVAHGDLKPSNIVLGAGGAPYLIDFNLAVASERPAGVPGGTLPYMAPEWVRAVAEAAPPVCGSAAQADVYAFGATIFQLLTGRLPVPAPRPDDPRTAAAELLTRLTRTCPRVRDRAPAEPETVARIVERCLATDPAVRPGADEIADALRRTLGTLRARRSRRPLAAVALAFAALGLAASGWITRPATAPQPVELQHQEPQTAGEFFDRGVRHLHAGNVPLACSDLDSALRIKDEGRTNANLAYCFGRLNQHKAAVSLGLKAREQGVTSSAVLNNLGHSLIEAARPEEAVPVLLDALEQDPKLRPARYNLARARFLVNRKNPAAADPACVADMDEVLATGPASREVLYLAGLIYAKSAALGPDVRVRAVRCLREAVLRGKNPARFTRDPDLKANLAHDPAFQRLTQMKPGPAVETADDWLVIPGEL